MFYIFCSFTLLVCGEKNILPNWTNSQEPELGVFGYLEPEPLEKKQKPEPLGKKNQEPESEPLEKKKSGAEAAKKFAGSPALKIRKSLPKLSRLPDSSMISILTFSESWPTNFIPAASNSGTYLGFTSYLQIGKIYINMWSIALMLRYQDIICNIHV